MKRILLAVGLLLVLGAGALGVTIWFAVSATTGPRIGPDRPGKALVLIDLQEDYTGPNARQPYPESAQLISSANQLMAAARAGGWQVFLVRVMAPDDWFHKLLTGGMVVAGTKGAELDARLARPPGFIEIVKIKGDAFSIPALEAKLDERQVGTLYIAGIDADHCVKATVGGARNRGYAVNVVREGIAVNGGKGLDKIVQGYEARGAVMKTLAQAASELEATVAHSD
ncbi:MAG: cysteine hydrolase [Polyangiaceae bacterium]|nr:cysteine hydrolase [Polyangiaceae bacterium]